METEPPVDFNPYNTRKIEYKPPRRAGSDGAENFLTVAHGIVKLFYKRNGR